MRIEGTFLDVTQLKEAEAALKESEDNLRLMFEMMPIGWAEHRMVFNADGEPQDYIFLDANPAFELFTGLERKKIIGKPVTEVISEIRTAKPDLIAIYGEVVRSGKEKTFDLYFQPLKRWYRVTAFKRDEARFVVMFEENTDRKKAEDNLFKSEERYRLAIEAAENGIYDWQIESNDIYFSDQWKAQLGYQPDELVNEFETWEKLLHPDDRQDIMQKVMDFIQNPSEFFFAEYQMEHKDGSYRWMQNKAKAFRDNNEKVVRMFGAHTDINERKKAEITIKKQLEEIL